MRIGYPCINWTIGCKGDRKFRLQSFSETRLFETVRNNLDCLAEMLNFNVNHRIYFFRITSDLVPFASHPICNLNWQNHFQEKFSAIGAFIKNHNIRISMHPGQFTILNSPDPKVLQNSLRELNYHAEVLDLLGLDQQARIQIHVGGTYGNKIESLQRFINQYKRLNSGIKNRLAIENEEKSYSLADCLEIFHASGVPIIFDVFHHSLNHSGESLQESFEKFTPTWSPEYGIPLVDYSSQQLGKAPGKHADTIDIIDFQKFILQTEDYDFDLMLEIKDKETSAQKVVELLKNDPRFYQNTGKEKQ